MKEETKARMIEVADMVAADAERDVHEAEGQALHFALSVFTSNGRNVSTFWGKQNAMIKTLAVVLSELAKEVKTDDDI